MTTATALMDSLDARQRAAVMSEAPHTAVYAGPGAGKTRVVVARIAWLLDAHRMPAHTIVVFAFTRAAAAEIRTRVIAMVGEDLARLLVVTTFHAWALGLLRRAGRTEGRVATQAESDEVLQGIFKGPEKRPEASRTGIKKVRAWIRTYASKGEEYVEFGTPEARVATLHLARLARRGLLPIDTVLPELMLRWDEIRHNVFDIKHVIVDEAHDLTLLEARLVRMIGAKTTVVLDERQCIFEWRGASPEAIEELTAEAVMIHLDQTYRFGEGIAAIASEVAQPHGYGPIRSAAEMASTVVQGLSHEQFVSEVGSLAKEFGPSNVAVLCRTNHECERVDDLIGLDAKMHVVRRPAYGLIGTAIAIMRLALNHDDDAAFRELWFMEGDGAARLRQLEAAAGHARGLMEQLKRETSLHESPHTILAACRYDVPGNFGVAWNRAKTFWNAEKDEDNGQLATYWDLVGLPCEEALLALSQLADADGFNSVGDRVAIATVHAAKGREWDAVFVLDFPERNVEDARVRFVAYTRARKVLAVVEGLGW